MKFDYTRNTREYRKWLADNHGSVVNPRMETIPELEEFIRSGSTEIDCRLAAQNLRYLANWLERCGVAEIADGNPSGWQTLARAAQCEFWHIHVKCVSFDRASNKRKASNFIPNCISASLTGLFCLSLNLWEKGAQISNRLRQSKEDGSLSAWESKTSVMTLAIALGTPESPSLEDANDKTDFSFFVNGETSASRLEEELQLLVDYHVEVIENEDEHSREFDRTPYDLFPVEICAIYKARERLGLKTPPIDHPLLNTPFGNPPRDIPKVEDPLLNRVIEKVSGIMPEVLN